MQVQFVSFAPVSSTEHYLSALVFAIFQFYAFSRFLRSLTATNEQEKILGFFALYVVLGVVVLGIALLAVTGKIPRFTMRFLALLGFGNKTIAIVKSVSEHQPTSWGTYWFDEHFLCFMTATGILVAFQKVNDANLFAILYGVFASYFSNIMIRLMLVVSPAMCVLGMEKYTYLPS